ncbi:MAG: ATP synthase F1 subunit gamma [Bacteroidota bacterium]
MPSLKDIRIRIKSVTSTQQITSAMKMVSAAKLRRAQDAIIKMRPYAGKLRELLENLSSGVESQEIDIYARKRDPKKVLIVVFTSNKGLCGAFNANIVKRAQLLIQEEYSEAQRTGNLHLMCIGKKGGEYFRKRNFPNIILHNELLEAPSFEKTVPIVEEIIATFRDGGYDAVDLVYNQFKNAAVQRVIAEKMLPISPPETKEKKSGGFRHDFILEPSKEVIVSGLIPKSLKIQFYKAMLDSLASEHGARMTAMHKATDNAGEILKDLRLTYNKVRQAQITREIVEIVSGANALNG